MTDKELAKRMVELRNEFGRFCLARVCKDCELRPIAEEFCGNTCAHVWIWKKMKEEEEASATPNESPMAKEEATLPAWCKVGQWVFFDGDQLGRITSLEKYSNPTYAVDLECMCGVGAKLTRYVKDLKPVRFRPYSFEEAKGLIGKVMEMVYDGRRGATLIRDTLDYTDGADINGHSHELLSGFNATIDGIPIGVPEVDEDAMIGGEE